MSKKKRFNWKARQVVNTLIDDSATKKIKLDLDVQKDKYDESNELVLPSAKRITKIKDKKLQVTKILSKKHRKRLEKIVERKKKKENRSELIEALSKVQIPNEELNQLTSISSVQTKGLKRHFNERNFHKKEIPERDLQLLSGEVKPNSLSGAKKLRLGFLKEQEIKSDDPNVVGVYSDSDDVCDSEIDVNEENNVEEDGKNLEDVVMIKKENDEEKKLDKEENLVAIENAGKEKNVDKEHSFEGENVVEENVNKENGSKEKESKENINKENVKKNINKNMAIEKDKKGQKTIFVEVNRSKEIQKARFKLPILLEEQQIMEVINENSVVILAGETGSGKTTQVPQFLYEAGYALNKIIAITEPRRIAAISMSKRVAEEMNLSQNEVSYLIRFEGNVTENTKVKFMTDGVLLKEIQNDFLLKKYSAVILDEAHERSVYTDVLVGFLSRIVPLRAKKGDPLKLVIMSATLKLEDFTENRRLFKKPPPVLKVETRQFPVTVHFNKRTGENYLKEAFLKTIKIHTKLPDGGVLIFVTGQREVNFLVSKLRKAFPFINKGKRIEENKNDVKSTLKKKKTLILPKINLDDYGMPGDTIDSEFEEDSEDDFDTTIITNTQPLWVLPLYSLLPSEKQARVFEAPPEGCRLCVVSTNVAETSLTIPNVKYVVDTGKTKVKLYDKITGVTSYLVTWTSKASADQRAGRAGRTAPGHCYRLYSSAVFNDTFEDFTVPEIQKRPVDDLYLQLKCMHIDKVMNFPFPSAPDLLQLKTAEKRLKILGALNDNEVTPLGRAISRFPVLPRFGKMLALSHQHDLLPYTICLVAALSVQEVLKETPLEETTPELLKSLRQKWMALRKQWAGVGNSLLLGDPMVLLKAVGAAEYANSQGKMEEFCLTNGLRKKAVLEIRKLRIQLTNDIKMNVPGADIYVDPKLEPPTDVQAKLLRQILLSGMGDKVAKKINPDEKGNYKYAYRANEMEDPVFLHQSSVLRQTLPEYVIYQEIYETNKMYMRGVTAIEPEWLPIYVPHLCNLSEALSEPQPRFEPANGKIYCTVNGSFGSQSWPLPNVEIEFPNNIESYKWFARFFLEGKVFPKLEKYRTLLLSPPGVMIKSWAKLQTRTVGIMKALMSKGINCKSTLEDVWKESPKFLLEEYLRWMPQSAHGEISLFWPPID